MNFSTSGLFNCVGVGNFKDRLETDSVISMRSNKHIILNRGGDKSNNYLEDIKTERLFRETSAKDEDMISAEALSEVRSGLTTDYFRLIPPSNVPATDGYLHAPANSQTRMLNELLPPKIEPKRDILPLEILSRIFESLNLEERKNVRLVSRSWHEACNTQLIQSKEKLSIGTLLRAEIDRVFYTLFYSERKCLNLEFHGIDFKRKPRALFWKRCGRRLFSLRLARCKISAQALISIINYCTELEVLRFDFDDLNELQNGVKIDALDVPIFSSTRNTSLKTLEIQSNSWSYRSHNLYWLRLISQFFRLFPCLSSFSLLQRELIKPSQPPNPLFVNVETTAHFQLIHETFLDPQMQNIALDFLCHPKLEWNSLASLQGLNKITEITIDIGITTDLSSLSKFILKQWNLKKIVCLISSDHFNSNQLLDKFISFVLKKPSLCELTMFMSSPIAIIRWNVDWFSLINSSKLRALSIRCCRIEFINHAPGNCANLYMLDTDAKLTTLSIRVKENHDSSIVPFMWAFPKLKELDLSHISTNIIAAVHHQAELVSLSTYNLEVAGNNSFTAPRYLDLRTLCHLEKLVIPSIMMSISNHSDRLKYLHILQIFEMDELPMDWPFERHVIHWDMLKNFLLKCPFLEVVWIDPFTIHASAHDTTFADSLIACISRLENLRFLYLAHDRLGRYSNLCLTEDDVSMIFHQCPSLKVFIYEWIYVADDVERFHKRFLFESREHRSEFLEKYMPIYVGGSKKKWSYYK